MGVIALKVEEVLPKEAEPKPISTPAPVPPVTSAPCVPPLPDLSAYPVVPLEQIAIPDEFLRTQPSTHGPTELQAQIQEWGELDEPLVVERSRKALGYLRGDGYRRYLIARQLGWDAVSVRIGPDGHVPA